MRYIVCLLFFIIPASLCSYQSTCDSAFCKVLESSLKKISELKSTVEEGTFVTGLGSKADSICNSAIEEFSVAAPLLDDDQSNEIIFDKKVEDLEKFLDAPLHVVYLKQLNLIRDKALKLFKSSTASSEGSEFEAMMQADELFRREAEDSTRASPEWTYAREQQTLKAALAECVGRGKKLQDAKLQAAKQNQQAMQYLQMQQQQLQAIQQQIQGASSPWNAALAYRIPDSNINLSLNYQQGRANVQLSCVPDESVPLLGANGFVNGVTPGNVGLSFNVNI